MKTDRTLFLRRVRMALLWLLAGVHLSLWADPMRPLTPPASAASAATIAWVPSGAGKLQEGQALREPERLIAIRQDGEARWQALFGDKWVSPGDKLERYTIAAIDANSVQLTAGRAKKTLHLLPPLLRPEPSKTPDLAQARSAALSPQRALGLSTP